MKVTSTASVVVEGGGRQVVSHAGLHALGSFADSIGLGTALSEATVTHSNRLPLHDRGKVMSHLLLVLAGGGESCADIEYLRVQRSLFRDVCSDSTLYRTMHELHPLAVLRLKAAVATVRADVWKRMPEVWRNEGILDFDASLVEIHSENKERAAPTYKGGYGFHPLFCFFDGTGETLASMLRPGNAGANDVEHHVSVLEEAITQATIPHWCGATSLLVPIPPDARMDLSMRAGSAMWASASSPDPARRSALPSHSQSTTRGAGGARSARMASRRRALPWQS